MNSSVENAPRINAEHLVNSVFNTKNKDRGDASNLRRANNPKTQHYAWEILIRLGFSLQNPTHLAVVNLIASNIAFEKTQANGTFPFAKALANSSNGKSDLRFNRLISASNTIELCKLIQSSLKLIRSKGIFIDYVSLTYDLLQFDSDRDKIRIKWAEQYFIQQKYKEKAEG